MLHKFWDHTLYPHKAHNQICATTNDQSHSEANVTVNTSKISHSQSLIITLRSAPRLWIASVPTCSHLSAVQSNEQSFHHAASYVQLVQDKLLNAWN